jgi:diadenosine tetraphosphate (Ap4A) HIT family hydrolase
MQTVHIRILQNTGWKRAGLVFQFHTWVVPRFCNCRQTVWLDEQAVQIWFCTMIGRAKKWKFKAGAVQKCMVFLAQEDLDLIFAGVSVYGECYF